MSAIPAATLIIDTREQRAYTFDGYASKHVDFCREERALPAGDYMACLPGDDDEAAAQCVIERKTHADLYATVTHGRERFERELEKLQTFGFAALVIESTLASIARGPGRSGAKASPRAVLASLVAFAQRYGVHVVFAGDRLHAEAYTWRLLERWIRDRAGRPAAVPDTATDGDEVTYEF